MSPARRRFVRVALARTTDCHAWLGSCRSPVLAVFDPSCPADLHGPILDEHLSVDLDAPDRPGRRDVADVLYSARAQPPRDAAATARQVLLRHPGCLVALVGTCSGGALALTAGEPRLCSLLARVDARPMTRQELETVASLLHTARTARLRPRSVTVLGTGTGIPIQVSTVSSIDGAVSRESRSSSRVLSGAPTDR